MPRPKIKDMTKRDIKKEFSKLLAKSYTAIDELRNFYGCLNEEEEEKLDATEHYTLDIIICYLLEANDRAERCVKRL